jgi:hypothetical protein
LPSQPSSLSDLIIQDNLLAKKQTEEGFMLVGIQSIERGLTDIYKYIFAMEML